ncbi:type II toxin-antitoxin system Phd/YefM family antitoxin [Streptomyces sp. ISL-90]|nr:type II toxin-antitoxin system Phd/YefM family antitoxin [Streptomyces sp. ISL-90]
MTPNGDSVNIYQAKTEFSRLIARVEAGERIVISRSGRPVARLVPYTPERAPRRPGAWKGRVSIAADFDSFTADDAVDWFDE